MKHDVYKGFKKIQEDERTATMAHTNGHKLQIVKGNLSPKLRRQLSSLPLHQAGGGQAGYAKPVRDDRYSVDDSIDRRANGDPDRGMEKEPPSHGHGMELQPEAGPMGGARQYYRMAEGGDVPMPDPSQPQDNSNSGPVTINIHNGAPGPTGPIDAAGNPVQDSGGNAAAIQQAKVGEQELAQRNIAAQAQKQMAAQAQQQATAQRVAPNALGVPAAAPQAPAPAAPSLAPQAPKAAQPEQDMFGEGAFEKSYLKGLGEQQAGISQEANATGQLGMQQAAIREQESARATNAYEEFNNSYQGLNEERQAFQRDLPNIDPQHYMHDMSTPKRISTAIGLILGGIGGGLLGQENPALKMLNAQIDRDIQAQQANLGKKKSLLEANLHQFGNLKDATAMNRVMMTDIASNELARAAAQTQDAAAKGRALKEKGILDMNSAATLQSIASNQSLGKELQRQAGGQISAINPSDLVKHVVPEADQKEVFKEIGARQEAVKLYQNMNQVSEQLAKKLFNGALSPNDTASAQNAFAGIVQKLSEGRYNEDAARKIVTSLLPQGLDTAKTVKNKDERRTQFFQALAQAPTAKGNRLDLDKYQSTRIAPPPEVATKNGVQYMKVQGGWKKVQ